MKNKIIRLRYEYIRNETHVEYHEAVSRLMEKYGLASLGGEEHYTAYKDAYKDEASVLDVVRKSEYTQKILKQDKVRDRIFRGLVYAIKSAQNHFDAEVEKQGKSLDLVLKHYKNITKKPLDQQTAAVDDFIREVRDKYQTRLDNLNLNGWISAISHENEQFRQLVARRDTESSQRPKLRMTDARKKVDKCFRKILNYIEAITFSTNSNQYDAFIKELNVLSGRYRRS